MSAATALSLSQARRLALAAQGFTDPAPTGVPDRRLLRRVIGRVGLLQIDSVNVLARAHYLPLFSRLGPYPMELLDRMAYDHTELFEYWGHEASFIPVGMQPLFRWRMARALRGEMWGGLRRIAEERPDLLERVLAEVAARGPLKAGVFSEKGAQRGPWWGWDEGKRAFEWLFWTGQLAVARRVNFERLYDLPERVLPSEVLDAPTPTEAEAHRALLLMAARSHGVGTARDLADYFRIPILKARPRLAELVEEGLLLPAAVEGWREPAYLDPAARVPRWVRARALLAPFDPVVWERARSERLFGFHYRIEIYTPVEKRRYGYYVLPFLLGDRLVARVDLKADRQAGLLRAHAAYAEEGVHPLEVAEPLAAELQRMAAWLGLGDVAVGDGGDLGPALRLAARSSTVGENAVER
jgi:uncharacterized protein